MNNQGFVIEVINGSNEVQSVELFTGKPLNEYIMVHTRNNGHQYNSLLEIARTKNFQGTGIKMDHDQPLKLSIHKSGSMKQIDLVEYEEGLDILMDGFDNYITIDIPPKNEFVIQLI